MPKYADRVAVISTTTGLATMVLSGAVFGRRSFGTALGISGNTEVFYTIDAESGEWENGIGTFLGASNSLQRDTPTSSSTGGAKVAFPSGDKTVYIAHLADVSGEFQSRRAVDITLKLRAITSQSVPVLQTYNGAGLAALAVNPDGLLILSASAGEMMRIGMEPTGGKWVELRNDLLGAPGNDGVRWRLSGTGGTTGFWQVSAGDSGFMQVQPSTAEIKGVNSAGDPGVTFTEGISVRNANADIGGQIAGHVAFDCVGETANTAWDIGPANNAGSGNHTVRLGRRSGTNTTVNLVMLQPGTATSKITLSSNGKITADWAALGDYFIGGNSAGNTAPARIAAKTGQAMVLQGGLNTSDSPIDFRNNDDTSIAEISPAGTASPKAVTVITRTKGDTRYAAISSLRFKEDVADAYDLDALFYFLKRRAWTWGGEVPADDERYGTPGVGFIAEEVVEAMPEAGRYVRDGEERVLQSLDPLALIAVLHAKIAQLEERLEAVEGK